MTGDAGTVRAVFTKPLTTAITNGARSTTGHLTRHRPRYVYIVYESELPGTKWVFLFTDCSLYSETKEYEREAKLPVHG